MGARDRIVEQAKAYTRTGDYARALAEYARLLERNPLDLEAKIRMASLHARRGDRVAAADVYLEVAHTYESAGDLANAVKAVTQVLRLQPQRSDAYFWQADLLADRGLPAEARQWLEAAYRQLESQGRRGDAIRALERMVELDPGNVALLIRLGEALSAVQRRAEAVVALGRATDVLRMAEWTDDFIRVAERQVYLDPRNTELAKELATLYLRRRDPRAALHKLQVCYQAERSDPQTLNLIVEAFMDLRELDKAATILEVLAQVHHERGEPDQAAMVGERIAQLDPARAAPGGEAGAVRTQVTAPPVELLEDAEDTPIPLTTDELQLAPLERSLQTPQGSGTPRFLPAVTAQHRAADLGVPPELTTEELDLSDLEELAVGPGHVLLPEEDEEDDEDDDGAVVLDEGVAVASRRSDPSADTEVRPRKDLGAELDEAVVTAELDEAVVTAELDEVVVTAVRASRPATEELDLGDLQDLQDLDRLVDDRLATRPRARFRPATTVPEEPAPERQVDTLVNAPLPDPEES